MPLIDNKFEIKEFVFLGFLGAGGFTADSIGDRLQNAATVATTGGQIASYNI